MTDEKTTRPDPLDRLRRLGSSGRRGHELTDHGHELTGIADAWLRDVRYLQAKLHDMTADRDEWKRTYKDVPPDIMSTSMPLPLDADGVKWTLTETEFIDENGETQTSDFIIQNGKIYLSVPCKMGLHELNKCRHVTPKPHETIEDVRAYVRDTDWGAPDPYHRDPYGDVSSVMERAYACGLADANLGTSEAASKVGSHD